MTITSVKFTPEGSRHILGPGRRTLCGKSVGNLPWDERDYCCADSWAAVGSTCARCSVIARGLTHGMPAEWWRAEP
jgi:hypothetical protein